MIIKPEYERVARVAKKYKLGKEPSDFAYWQTKTPLDRMATLESIRSEYIKWKYGTNPGFHRVYKVIKRKSG